MKVVCMNCGKVIKNAESRDDVISHGICPECEAIVRADNGMSPGAAQTPPRS